MALLRVAPSLAYDLLLVSLDGTSRSGLDADGFAVAAAVAIAFAFEAPAYLTEKSVGLVDWRIVAVMCSYA